ncbi:hypothetical protein QT711_03345 [Sporosarcina saromensis]|uniref:Tail assembly chaperone n=1 Tax=Sporosarcina saromensis TaxID=359365 RepID=A0ABU4G5F7_9BACL|nr:hypothetical protein [Sporosarcina saromensis]MDW0112205.1 hypothetical protein [Sporosarcina saromensis]
MSKLTVIELKEYEIKEVNGEFERVVTNIERHPLYFNNHSLRVGKQYGILEKGLEQELFALFALMGADTVESVTKNGEMDSSKVLPLTELLTLDRMKDIIWLAYVGAKTDDYLDNEDFKELFDEDFETTMGIYVEVLMSNFQNVNKPNKFKAGLSKSTSKPKGGKK